MGFTTQQLTDLEAQIASATKSITEGDITVTNHDLDALMRTRDKMRAEIDAADASKPRQRRTFRVSQSGRGYR